MRRQRSSSSKQDDAKAQVCDARADISKQVDTLKGITVSAATLDQIQTSLKAIDTDLKTDRRRGAAT